MNSNFWKNKKVFVTGHTGFKGSWLTMLLLSMGAKVKGYSLPLNKENYLFRLIKEQISDAMIHIEGNILEKGYLEDQIKNFVLTLAVLPFPIKQESQTNTLERR